MRYNGYIYLDKHGVIHLLEDNGAKRSTLPLKVRQGYYHANIKIDELSRPENRSAFDVFYRAAKNYEGS